jgi:hypothetical protein
VWNCNPCPIHTWILISRNMSLSCVGRSHCMFLFISLSTGSILLDSWKAKVSHGLFQTHLWVTGHPWVIQVMQSRNKSKLVWERDHLPNSSLQSNNSMIFATICWWQPASPTCNQVIGYFFNYFQFLSEFRRGTFLDIFLVRASNLMKFNRLILNRFNVKWRTPPAGGIAYSI